MAAMRSVIAVAWLAIALLADGLGLAGDTTENATSRPGSHLRVRDPYPEAYVDPPDFLAKVTPTRNVEKWQEAMTLSFEPAFYTLCDLHGYSKPEPRSAALVKRALEKEQAGEFREALEIYQKVIEEYPDNLHRISRYGIYVPVSQYCQRRLLQFPRRDLAFYRTKHDERAREAFEQARAKHSLEGLAEVRDTMLATSYGGRAMLSLGDAALDRGHYLEALEYYETVRDFFPDKDLHTPALALKIRYCRGMLGEKKGNPTDASPTPGPPEADHRDTTTRPATPHRAALERLVKSATPRKTPFHSQLASKPNIAGDDYTLLPPTDDPLGLTEPVWRQNLPGSRHDFFTPVQPVATEHSIIYRHKNIIYSRSMLTGEIRWRNDLGGRVSWQNWSARQYPQEAILVQDGLVFTPIYKVGATLAAIDEITGQLKWAYGPMVAATQEEANLRFEAAPAGGPRTVYAGYVLDNIDGNTHFDTEYGVIAFESATGRIRWRRPVCRLRPGLFTAGFAQRVRTRIRSFSSPPIYHQGTVYYNTNAGAVAALDALSGRVKWTMRYPYYAFPNDVHDATRQFGRGGEVVRYTKIHATPHGPMFWYNQRPLLIGEHLYVIPVDSRYMFCIDRRTGRVRWTKGKGTGGRLNLRGATGGATYFLGTRKTGELVVVHSGRNRTLGSTPTANPVHLIDPETGRTLWASDDLVAPFDHPAMKYFFYFGSGRFIGARANRWLYQTAARPFLSSAGRVYVTSFHYWGWPVFGWVSNLAVVSLDERRIVARRRYLSGEILRRAAYDIGQAPGLLKALLDLPHKSKEIQDRIRIYKEIAADTVPVNEHGPFLPFSRLTFRRHGATFELRVGPRDVAMVYDPESVKRALAGRTDPEGLFARAELAIQDSRLAEAADLLKQCLTTISSEDVDFRATINQQLYRVHKRLARSGIRAGRVQQELDHCLGMSRTVGTLADEIETLFALAEVYQRKGDHAAAARMLRSIVSTYGHYEYPVPSLLGGDTDRLLSASHRVIDRGRRFVKGTLYAREFGRSLDLLRRGMPLYFSALSPLEKDLSVRAGELAAHRLIRLQKGSPQFAKQFETIARRELIGRRAEEQRHRLLEFPATSPGQQVLDALFRTTADQLQRASGNAPRQAELRKHLWRLADVARVCGLTVPTQHRARVTAPTGGRTVPLTPPFTDRADAYPSNEGTAWLLLNRCGDRTKAPNALFLGGRVKKRFDYKFVLNRVDATTGEIVWQATEPRGGRWTEELRLKGKGDEPGFFEAFVHGDLVVVHGQYDVLAFGLEDGKVRWRYQVPFDFQIKHALMSGDLLVLAGQSETVALYVATLDPRGEVAWQEREQGDLYRPPYFHGDRLVSVRKLPFNVTVRYRATGRLMGRLAMPDLSLFDGHPLLENGPKAVPTAHDGKLLVVSDGWYYIAVDVERMKVVWKRLIDQSDPTREPLLRFALKGNYLAVLKEDFDRDAIYMLSSRTGEVLWCTDPRDGRSPKPMHSMVIAGDRLYGIEVHPGQGFYFVGRDCRTGKRLFAALHRGYEGKPEVAILPRLFGNYAVALVKDRQDFELLALDLATGKLAHRIKLKGAGNFGEHGRVSATVQNGVLALLSKDTITVALGE